MKKRKVIKGNDMQVENLIAAVRSRVPILNDPDGLTDDILKAIAGNPAREKAALRNKSGELPAIIVIRRLLAAASVCLFLIFSYEEYVVVDKISVLEKQCSAVSQSSQYQAALDLKKVMTVITLNPKLINEFLRIKTRKIELQSVLKALAYADMTGFAPDALKLISKAEYRSPDPQFIAILKQFDSTINLTH